MTILNINGKPYTTATEDLRIEGLKKKFWAVLSEELTHAMQHARNGRLELNKEHIGSIIDAAYHMGREDQGGK